MESSNLKCIKISILIFVCINTLQVFYIGASMVIVKEIEFIKKVNTSGSATAQLLLNPNPSQKAAEFRLELVGVKIQQSHPPPLLVDIVPGNVIEVPNKQVQIIGLVKIVNTETIKTLTIQTYEGTTKAFEKTYPPTTSMPGDTGYTVFVFEEHENLPAGRPYRITRVKITVITEDVKITQTFTFTIPVSIDVAEK